MRRAWWWMGALGLLAACSSKNESDTRILVAVWSDFAIPTQMNSVRIDVEGPTTTPSTTFPLAADTKLPLVFELVSPDNQGSAFSVIATGYLGSTRLVSQEAHVSFIPDESLVLSLFLGRTCRNIDCPAEWTCRDGQCNQPVEVNPNTLPIYNPQVPFIAPDASTSAGVDAPVDGAAGTRLDSAGMETVVDAQVDAGMDLRPVVDSGSDRALSVPDSASDMQADVATFPDVAQDLARDRMVPDDLVRDLARDEAAPIPDAPTPDLPGRDAPAGADVDAPPDSPTTCPYACCAASDCPGSCQTCSASHTCVAVVSQDDPSGHCAGTCDATGACKAKPGQSCSAVPGGCIAGTSCADGYCCDSACTDSCEACDVPGRLGTCTTLAAGAVPRPAHPACASTDPACAGTCNGTSASCFYNEGPCGSASCSGSTYQPAGNCSNGACGFPPPQTCPNGQVCAGNACACDPPLTTCPGGACVDPQSDSNHCGGCDQSCSSNHGTSSCTDGTCHMATCADDYRDCSADENTVRDGCETYIVNDLNNCGQCGRVCPNDWDHASPSCAASDCGHVCTTPWDNCDGIAANGCEANLDTDGNHCGGCTKKCISTVCRARTCLTTARYGNTGAGSTTTGFSGGYLAGIQVYIPNASVVTGFGVVIYSGGTARNMYLGLYRDVAGNPSDLVATVTDAFVAAPAGTEVLVAAQVDIPAGNYWLLGIWDGAATFASNSTTPVAWRYASYDFGALPATAPVAMSAGSFSPPNLYTIVAQ